jgi:hypothetical protein
VAVSATTPRKAGTEEILSDAAAVSEIDDLNVLEATAWASAATADSETALINTALALTVSLTATVSLAVVLNVLGATACESVAVPSSATDETAARVEETTSAPVLDSATAARSTGAEETASEPVLDSATWATKVLAETAKESAPVADSVTAAFDTWTADIASEATADSTADVLKIGVAALLSATAAVSDSAEENAEEAATASVAAAASESDLSKTDPPQAAWPQVPEPQPPSGTLRPGQVVFVKPALCELAIGICPLNQVRHDTGLFVHAELGYGALGYDCLDFYHVAFCKFCCHDLLLTQRRG